MLLSQCNYAQGSLCSLAFYHTQPQKKSTYFPLCKAVEAYFKITLT